MWPNTVVQKKLKIKLPIIQAPMGGVTTPKLVAAVSNAGGLGSLAAGYLSPAEMHQAITQIRALTDKPFAVNLFVTEPAKVNQRDIQTMVGLLKKNCALILKEIKPVKPPFAHAFADQMQVILDEKVPIFSFTFGIPNTTWLKKLKKNKTILIGTATSVDEARLLEQRGIDLIVAQGYEAGGHRGTFLKPENKGETGLFALLPQIVAQVKIPVIAAGAIMDGHGIMATHILGAQAVQMGTAFMTCTESATHPLFKKALLKRTADNTVLTRAFTGRWARSIKNKFIDQMQINEKSILPYPIQHALTLQIRKAAAQKGAVDYLSLFCGQGAHLNRTLPAAKLLQKLEREVKNILDSIMLSFDDYN